MQNGIKFKSKPFSNKEFKSLSGLWKIDRVILDTLNYDELLHNIVNVVLTELGYLDLGYQIIVLTLVNKKRHIMERVAISKTVAATKALEKTPIPFHKIEVPLSSKSNLLVKSFKNSKIYITNDLSDVLTPAGSRKIWRDIQSVCRINTSIVYPIIAHNKSIGAMIFSLSKSEKQIDKQEWEILTGFTNAVGIAIENANLYKALKQANLKLKDLDKRKDEFLSVAAHELRAPLTAVKGYLSMVIDGDAGEISPQVSEFLSGAKTGAEREIRLVNNLLNVSRIEENRLVYSLEVINLAKIVKSVFDEFRFQASDKNLSLGLDISKNIKDHVKVDPDRIHEVVANFVSNAVKYTDKGSVNIRLFNVDAKTKHPKIRFEVEDTGFGMTKEEQHKLFHKFYRAESSAGKVLGTGLGLYITKLLVEKFRGEIGVISEKGRGSTFWFELPLNK